MTKLKAFLSHHAGSIALMILLSGHALFNALLSPIGSATTDCPIWWAYPAIGAMGAQPILCAMWATLSPSLLKGIPSAIFAVVFVSFADSVRSIRLFGTSMTQRNLFGHLYLALIVFALSAAMLILVRRYFKYRFVSTFDEPLHLRSSEHSQLGIRHLLSLTTGCAILLAFARFVLPLDVSQPQRTHTMLIELRQAVGGVATYFGIGCVFLFPAVVLPWITFTIRPKKYLLLFATLTAWIALSWLAIRQMGTMPMMSKAEATELLLLFQLGTAASACLSALTLRILGFRLVGVDWVEQSTRS